MSPMQSLAVTTVVPDVVWKIQSETGHEPNSKPRDSSPWLENDCVKGLLDVHTMCSDVASFATIANTQ
jgi:hypothetical protein